MYRYVFNRLQSHDIAFELTQDVFLSLWERRGVIKFETSGFLIASVRYQIINHINRKKVRDKYSREFSKFRSAMSDNSNEESVNLHDLEGAVGQSLKELPERCQQIFRMSRLQNRSISEIAQQLNISHRTVENQLSAALRHLRMSLGEFMVVVFLLLVGR